jgi:hypothetical protein
VWVLNDTLVALDVLGPTPVRASSSAFVKNFPQIAVSGTEKVRDIRHLTFLLQSTRDPPS